MKKLMIRAMTLSGVLFVLYRKSMRELDRLTIVDPPDEKAGGRKPADSV